MVSGSDKSLRRLEKKRKKLVALLNIATQNAENREREAADFRLNEVPSCSAERKGENTDDLETSYSSIPKKQKLENSESVSDEPDKNLNLNNDLLRNPTSSGAVENEKEEGEIVENSLETDGPEIKRHKLNDGVKLPCYQLSISDRSESQSQIKPILAAEELMKLRKELREKRNILKTLPKLLLNEMGDKASLSRKIRVPLFFTDLQHLILYSQLTSLSPVKPRWCSFEKASKISHTILFVVEGPTVYDYLSAESSCSFLPTMGNSVEIVTPMNYDGDIVEELGTVPLSKTQKSKLEDRYGNMKQAELNSGLVFQILKSIFPIDPTKVVKQSKNIPQSDRFPRTELLLSAWQMIQEGYPIPVQGELSEMYSDYVMTKDRYAEVTPGSPMWGLDCEMCLTSINKNELTRISIVNEQYQVVYESLVKPPNKIIDYLTRYSGITKEMMKNVTKTLEDVQRDLRNLLPPDVILVGQSLNFDLHALKIMHPYVIDTSVIYNLSGVRPRKSKLAILMETFLGEKIQKGHGHDSVEDSCSSLKLAKLKLAHSVEFGDAVLSGCSLDDFRKVLVNSNNNTNTEKVDQIFATSLFSHIIRGPKTAAVVGKDNIVSKYRPLAMMPSISEYKFNHSKKEKAKVKCQTVQTNREAVDFSCKEAIFQSFLLMHLKLENDETLADVDKWCSMIFESMVHSALFITVLAGNGTNKAHGACFVHTKNGYFRANNKSSSTSTGPS